MKKFAAILLALAICLSMGACSGEEIPAEPTTKDTEPPITSITLQPVEETLTESATEPPTEPVTVAPTEEPTEATTETPTETQTEPGAPPASEPEIQVTEGSGQDYVLNTNTGKFHYPSCSSVDEIKESNKDFYTGSREDLIAKGYDPCGRCHP